MAVRVLCLIGARPNFIKSAPLLAAMRARPQDITPFLVHSGQHYDADMSDVFFRDLELPRPDFQLGVGSGTHAEQTAKVLLALEPVFQAIRPDWVMVLGDVNSTLGGALAAAQAHIPVAHVEAGLRSYNRRMAEELNRVVTDHLSDLLLCPTATAVRQLSDEGLRQGVHLVGDVMYDVALRYAPVAAKRSRILEELRVAPKSYGLATLHRAELVDDPDRLLGVMTALNDSGEALLLPVHPRTRQRLDQLKVRIGDNLRLIPPAAYLDMLQLEQQARYIVTDSGGVQKEAFFFHVPCLTLRDETEWVETVEAGWNELVGTDAVRIQSSVAALRARQYQPAAGAAAPTAPFGDGHAAERIVDILCQAHRAGAVMAGRSPARR